MNQIQLSSSLSPIKKASPDELANVRNKQWTLRYRKGEFPWQIMLFSHQDDGNIQIQHFRFGYLHYFYILKHTSGMDKKHPKHYLIQ